ncbi:rhamnan synthesis F family protein [Aliiruegeria lutimaris]|uniref:Rhamnosyltransferase n=1 Tax=Aliiruegeria lutimaris TaxID=571298 RepID=A0A1G9DE04_9RHOB|nr:rhamnan synthesis F family protein [Aliiruegeria lutimaris]SDK62024.1 rhamnosyltransferase [Aliiruegeria lutimaris]
MRGLIYTLEVRRGGVSGYALHCLEKLRPIFDHILVVCSDVPETDTLDILKTVSDDLLPMETAPNHHLEGYQKGLQHLGWDQVRKFDDLTLMDHDLVGPVFPVEDVYAHMEERGADLWSLGSRTDGKAVESDPDNLVSVYLCFGSRVLRSADFENFWSNECPKSDGSGVWQDYAFKLAPYFQSRGYTLDAFIRPENYETIYPLFLEMNETLQKGRSPFFLLHPFHSSPALLDEYQINLERVIPYLESVTDYPTRLLWDALLKTTSLRTLHTNLAYQFTFDSKAYNNTPQWDSSLRIAACAHIYYPEAFDEIYARVSNIPHDFDFYVTTASEENKAVLEGKCAEAGITADIRVVGENRGRDMSSLYIDLKDVVMDKNYDLICRLHSKKSPQVHPTTGKYFKNLIFDSVLANRAYTSHLLDFLVTHPHVGMAFAPMIHTGYRTMGHAWYDNRPVFSTILADLNCTVPEEPFSPLAAYGTVYWFRPDALRPMFDDQYQYCQYNKEPDHLDGGLAHGQERAMTYVAQSRGYMSATVWPDFVAAQSTTLMEYKMDSLYSNFPMSKVAPHSNLMAYVSGLVESKTESRRYRLRTPRPLRQFEEYCRPAVKMVGAALGIKHKKKKPRP